MLSYLLIAYLTISLWWFTQRPIKAMHEGRFPFNFWFITWYLFLNSFTAGCIEVAALTFLGKGGFSILDVVRVIPVNVLIYGSIVFAFKEPKKATMPTENDIDGKKEKNPDH